jgi:hypothetical protein
MLSRHSAQLGILRSATSKYKHPIEMLTQLLSLNWHTKGEDLGRETIVLSSFREEGDLVWTRRVPTERGLESCNT